MVIGITGSFGTGKTTVAGMFARLGAVVIDADAVVHDLLERDDGIKKKLVDRFGDTIFDGKGGIDRSRLAKLAFARAGEVEALNRITHPVVIAAIKEAIGHEKKRDPAAVIVVDAPLLFETGLDGVVDRIVVVSASLSRRAERLAEKGFAAGDLESRTKMQMDLTEKERRADYLIDNNASPEQTGEQVIKIWEKLKKQTINNSPDAFRVRGGGNGNKHRKPERDEDDGIKPSCP